MKVQCSF